MTTLTKKTHSVICHHCGASTPRHEATAHGNPCFGALWHCRQHVDCTYCAHGSWCDINCDKRADRLDNPPHPHGHIACNGRHTKDEQEAALK